MRRLLLFASFGALVIATTGCDAILGVSTHSLAPDAGSSGNILDSGSDADGGSNANPDGAPGTLADSGVDAAIDAPGGPVSTVLCGDSGACISGGIFSVGRGADDAGTGIQPDGGIITLTDDGFEFGETKCDTSGTTCVTGAITP